MLDVISIGELWYNNNVIIKLILQLSVKSVTERSTEAVRPARNSFVSLHRWTWTLHQAAH